MASGDTSLSFFESTAPNYDLTTDDDIAQFLSSEESLEEPDLNGPTTLHCEICGKKFDNAKKYYGHLRIHSKDNPWKCGQCPDKKFSTKQQLMKHSLIHKPLERVWKCQTCNYDFKDLWALQQHWFAKHLNLRPIKCDQCPKAFYKPSDLKRHKDTHLNIRKYKCKLCDKTFTDKSNLTRHSVIHNKLSKFICPGCSAKYTQPASLNRHKQKCALFKIQSQPSNTETNYNSNNIDSPESQRNIKCIDKEKNSSHNDVNKTVDNIVDDILSVEDDYVAMGYQNVISENKYISNNVEELLHLELLKDINSFPPNDEVSDNNHLLRDSTQTNITKPHTSSENVSKSNENVNLSPNIEQNLVNALYLVNEDNLPYPTLDIYKTLVHNDLNNLLTNTTVTVNESTIIFESDVDLEASANLAANLNKLIGVNGVQYIYKDDYKFVISLDNVVNAQQVKDGNDVEHDENMSCIENTRDVQKLVHEQFLSDTIAISLNSQKNLEEVEKSEIATCTDKAVQNSSSKEVKVKKQTSFTCDICKKVFNRKFNYKSHLGVHEASKRRFRCAQCDAHFASQYTLTRHVAARHAPSPAPALAHACPRCSNTYPSAWRVREHVQRDHEKLTPHACAAPGCDRSFYKKSDLVLHTRYHNGERAFACARCGRSFVHRSHLARHLRSSCCLRRRPAPRHKKKRAADAAN